jgi:predicted anti-sigma-YlaC factor YlaD
VNQETAKFGNVCSQSDIAAYLDGELDVRSEEHLEAHLIGCDSCFTAMREQKMVLCALNAMLDNKAQIELPVNFAKRVTVHAESNVSGLRKREERWMAVTLCVMLFGLIAAIALAGDTSGLAGVFSGSVKIAYSLAVMISGFLYNIGLGLTILIRAITRSFISGSDLSILGILLLIVLSLAFSSTLLFRFRSFKF